MLLIMIFPQFDNDHSQYRVYLVLQYLFQKNKSFIYFIKYSPYYQLLNIYKVFFIYLPSKYKILLINLRFPQIHNYYLFISTNQFSSAYIYHIFQPFLYIYFISLYLTYIYYNDVLITNYDFSPNKDTVSFNLFLLDYYNIYIYWMFGKLSLIFVIIAIGYCGPVTNTTNFWEQKVNHSLTFQSYSGYQQVDWYYPSGKSGMFYQLYGAYGANPKIANPRIPILIWLQGGPGSSSQFGAHQQIGPIRIRNGAVVQNSWAWNIFGHLLFIDSPLNVGFSFNGDDRLGNKQVSSTDQAANHLVNFLVNFYKTWPELLQSPVYITGQSFGGHYIPVLAQKLLTNTTLKNTTGTVEGVAIGDPWTDPINQINYYDTYLWSVGVIDRGFRDVCTWFQTNGIVNMYEGNYKNATAYFDFITNNDTTPQYYMGNISIFGFRNYNGLDLSFAKFLQANKQNFGVAGIQYLSGNDKIYTAFENDVTRSVARNLVQVIKRIKVLIYNGQQDVVVNTPGVLQFLNSLNWESIGYWKRTPKQIWTINNQVTGWAKVYGNLWFVLVNKAGHMVPTDQPRSAFNMLGHFINNQWDWNL